MLGGGVGQAPGFAEAVTAELRPIAPVMPDVRVSALGTDAVVDGCLASGAELAWAQLTGSAAGPPARHPRPRPGWPRPATATPWRPGDRGADGGRDGRPAGGAGQGHRAGTGGHRRGARGAAPPAGRNRVPGPRLLGQRRGVRPVPGRTARGPPGRAGRAQPVHPLPRHRGLARVPGGGAEPVRRHAGDHQHLPGDPGGRRRGARHHQRAAEPAGGRGGPAAAPPTPGPSGRCRPPRR